MQKQTYSKITKIIVVAVLMNFSLANLAWAQGSTSSSNVTLTNVDLQAAQASEAACMQFRTEKVEKVLSRKFKAIWDPGGSELEGIGMEGSAFVTYPPSCFIAPAWFSDTAKASTQPQGSVNIETAIREGKGLSEKDVQKNYLEDLESQNQANGLSKVLGWVLKFIFDVVNSVLGILTGFAMMIMAYAIDEVFKVTSMPGFVQIGWGIVRDFANMFFIVILIIIALGSILRLEKLEYRHLLGKLVLMAILVNFSQVIAVAIMNFVNAIAAIFLIEGDLQSTFSFIFKYVWDDVGSLPNGWMTGLTQGLMMTAFSIVTLVVSLMLAALFIVRLVGLYVLIIFSPVAYVLNILPATEHYAKEWWHTFVKYLIWAPISLFMIKLATLVVNAGGMAGGNKDSAYKYIFLMALMVAAVYFPKKAGMVGGDLVIKSVEKGAHFAGHATDKWLAKGAAMEGGGGWNRIRRAGSYLSVGALKKGWEARSHHKEEEAYTVAAGKRADLFNKVISREDSDFALKARNQRIASEMKQIPMKDKEEMTERAAHFLQEGELDKGLGYVMKLASQGDLNEVLNAMKDKRTGQSYTANAEGLQRMFDDHIVPKMGKSSAYRLGAEISKVAEEVGHWNFAGSFTRNAETKEYEPNREQARYANIQRSKLNPQNNIRTIGRLGAGFVEQNKDGVWTSIGIDDHGVEYLRNIRGDQLQEWERNGNKHLKANIVINQSSKVLEINPEAWAAAAEEYASLDPDGRNNMQQMVAAPVDVTTQTINVQQVQRFFEELRPEIKTKYERGDKEIIKKYQNLYKYAYPGAATPTPAPPTTPNPPAAPPNAPPPPPGWAPGVPGGRIIVPPNP